jgi:hypothetical protein
VQRGARHWRPNLIPYHAKHGKLSLPLLLAAASVQQSARAIFLWKWVLEPSSHHASHQLLHLWPARFWDWVDTRARWLGSGAFAIALLCVGLVDWVVSIDLIRNALDRSKRSIHAQRTPLASFHRIPKSHVTACS